MHGQIGMRQIGRTTEQLRQYLGKRCQRVLTGFARRQSLALRRACGDQSVCCGCKFGRKIAMETAGKLGPEDRICVLVTFERAGPGWFERSAVAARIPGLRDGVRNLERRVGPVERGTYACDLLGTERSAVRILMPMLGGSATGNHGLAAQQTRPGRLCKCRR